MRYLAFIFLLSSFLFAHKINLFITNEGDTIEVYSYFANGAPCKNCRMFIKNEDNIILEDKLNEAGLYVYELEYKNIEVVIDASAGHIAKETVVSENVKTKNIEEHKEEEEEQKYLKILLGVFILGSFFYLLKRFKK